MGKPTMKTLATRIKRLEGRFHQGEPMTLLITSSHFTDRQCNGIFVNDKIIERRNAETLEELQLRAIAYGLNHGDGHSVFMEAVYDGFILGLRPPD